MPQIAIGRGLQGMSLIEIQSVRFQVGERDDFERGFVGGAEHLSLIHI